MNTTREVGWLLALFAVAAVVALWSWRKMRSGE